MTGKIDKPRPDKEKRRHYRQQYLRWLWPYRSALLGVFLLAVLGAGLDLAWPLEIKRLIDGLDAHVAYPVKLHRLGSLGILILVLLVTRQAVDSIRGYRTTVLNSKVVFTLRHRLFERLLNVSLGDLAEMKSGGIVSRLSSDVESVSGLIQMALISPGVAIIRVLLTVIVLFYLSWQLAMAALIILPPLAITSFWWLRRVRPIYRSTQADRTDIDARVNETFGGIRVVRSFRREPHEERSYAVGHHTIIRKRLYAERMEMVLEGGLGGAHPDHAADDRLVRRVSVPSRPREDRRYLCLQRLRDAVASAGLADRVIGEPDAEISGRDGARVRGHGDAAR